MTPSITTSPAVSDDLPRVVDALARLGEVMTEAPDQRSELPLEALRLLEHAVVQRLLAQPSGWLNEVCQAALADEVPDHAVYALRWILDRSLMHLQHDGGLWSVYALNGRLLRPEGEALPVVLDGLIDQADELSLAITGEAGRVRCSVQYFTSSSVFPYPEINLWTAALSSLGMPLIDRTDLATYNALGMDGDNAADDTPLLATHAMLLLAVNVDGLSDERANGLQQGTLTLPTVNVPYHVGPQTRSVDLLEPRLAPVFTSQGMLSCRDDVEHLTAFASDQYERLGKSWDGVVAFLYPTHTLETDADDGTMDVHHLQRVSVVLWAERLDMLVAGYTTRVLPGPAVMRLLGSLSARLSEMGVPQVHFLPPQSEEAMQAGDGGRRLYLTPSGPQTFPDV